VSRERPGLSRKAKALVATGLALVLGLVTALAVAFWLRRLEAERDRRTRATLASMNQLVGFNLLPHHYPAALTDYFGVVVTLDEPDDETGQVALRRETAWEGVILGGHGASGRDFIAIRGDDALGFDETCSKLIRSPREPVLDAWGHPIRYKHPGTVHKHGWDLYSVGPNGIDEQGGGDDILLGADVAPETSAR
jgi:hypothetical protein